MVLLPGCQCCGGGKCSCCRPTSTEIDKCCAGEPHDEPGICCEDVWYPDATECCGGEGYVTGEGECCGGVWHTADEEGECCAGVWRTEAGTCCKSGSNEAWHTGEGECCGTLWIAAADAEEFICCSDDSCGENNVIYYVIPVSEDFGCSDFCVTAGPIHQKVDGECKQVCCVDGECSYEFPDDCTGTLIGLCMNCESLPCPIPCCVEDANGRITCEQVTERDCTNPAGESCETGGVGACCVYDGEGLTTHTGKTPEECDALGGCFAGCGTTGCQLGCREPYTQTVYLTELGPCCEQKQVTAEEMTLGLTFYQPRLKRCPPFSDTIRVRVTGCTKSDIMIHGTLVTAEEVLPEGKCGTDFDIEFDLCWEAFNIEPLPCGSTFAGLDVTVCWSEVPFANETLNFSGCNGITVWLGYCPNGCVTTLSYNGGTATSNATIIVLGNAVIASDGGPLTLTGSIVMEVPTFNGVVRADDDCARTLTLSGTSTADNEIQSAIPDYGDGVSVEKTGSGRWILSGDSGFAGQFTLTEGTIVVGADVDSGNTASPLGTSGLGLIPTIYGGAMLLADDVSVNREIAVAETGGSAAVLGGEGSGTSEFFGGINLGRDITLQAAPYGTFTFAPGSILNESGNYDPAPAVAITVGSDGNDGNVVLQATLPSSITAVNVVRGTATIEIDNNIIDPTTPVTVGSAGGSAVLDLNGWSQELESLTFAGTESTVTGGTLELSDALVIGGTGHEIASTVTLADGVTASGTGSLTISGDVSGTGSLTQSGSGTLTLTAANTYAGATRAVGGTIEIGSEFAAQNSTVDMNSADSGDIVFLQNSTVGGLSGSRNLDLSGATLSIGNNNSSTTYSGDLSNGAITKIGTGTLTLTGANTYSGDTDITAGTLVIAEAVTGAGNFDGATFTSTALTVAFSSTPTSGATYRILPGATVQTYATVTLSGAPGMTGSYNSSTSTLTVT